MHCWLLFLNITLYPLFRPPRRNRQQPRDYDHYLYRERHLVECLFNKIKHFRRLFSRFDKLASRYLGFLNFVASLIWLR